MSKVRPEKKKTRNSTGRWTMSAWFNMSALVKLYIEEEGTDRAIEAVPTTDRHIYISNFMCKWSLRAGIAVNRNRNTRGIKDVKGSSGKEEGP